MTNETSPFMEVSPEIYMTLGYYVGFHVSELQVGRLDLCSSPFIEMMGI